MTSQQTQHQNTVIIARDLGDSLEVILRTDNFDQACLIFLEEWQKDRRIIMIDYVESVIIAACALRSHRQQETVKDSWPKAR